MSDIDIDESGDIEEVIKGVVDASNVKSKSKGKAKVESKAEAKVEVEAVGIDIYDSVDESANEAIEEVINSSAGKWDNLDDGDLSGRFQRLRRDSYDVINKELSRVSAVELWRVNRAAILDLIEDACLHGVSNVHFGDLRLPSGNVCYLQEAYGKLSSHLNNLQLRSFVKVVGDRFKIEISWMG